VYPHGPLSSAGCIRIAPAAATTAAPWKKAPFTAPKRFFDMYNLADGPDLKAVKQRLSASVSAKRADPLGGRWG
jgi:hypothetical protein